jgi:hypothetical protein
MEFSLVLVSKTWWHKTKARILHTAVYSPIGAKQCEISYRFSMRIWYAIPHHEISFSFTVGLFLKLTGNIRTELHNSRSFLSVFGNYKCGFVLGTVVYEQYDDFPVLHCQQNFHVLRYCIPLQGILNRVLMTIQRYDARFVYCSLWIPKALHMRVHPRYCPHN